MENSGKLKTVDEIDPANNRFDYDNFAKFLSDFDHTFSDRSKPKGPDYLIIDNFTSLFELSKGDLFAAKKEAWKLSNEICDI